MTPRTVAVALAAAMLAMSPAVEAQQAEKLARIGLLSSGAAGADAFRAGMRALGYVEGKTFTVDYRHDDGTPGHLHDLAMKLVQTQPDVIVVAGPDRIRAVQQATTTIPVVMAVVHEPVAFGFAASLARPGGNITGVAFQDTELTTKRLELLREVRPTMSRVAAFSNPAGGGQSQLRSAAEAAKTLGLTVQVFEVRDVKDLAAVFDAARKAKSNAVLQLAAPFFSTHRRAFVELTLKHRLPTGCEQAQFVELGCLMSYGPDFADMYRRAAVYVDKILKGAKPADLPIEQAGKFVLAINVKTAKALGIRVPESVLQRADRVIE